MKLLHGKERTEAPLSGLRLALIGPIAPPHGGMAHQTAALLQRYSEAGAEVELLASNAPYQPRAIARWRGWRALLRLVQYIWRVWRVCDRVQVLHIMANSGWSWHLVAAPAIWIARWRGVGVLLNYRGGDAASFLHQQGAIVLASLRRCDAVVVPSEYLREVFSTYQLASVVIPNVINPRHYYPSTPRVGTATILMTRQLEAIYDHASAIRALKRLQQNLPSVRLLICGDGAERVALEQLVDTLGLRASVEFTGALSAQASASLYRQAQVLLNTSKIDNAPNSIVEAWASGVPVVTTSAGGVPFLVRDEIDALLVPVEAPEALAQQLIRLLQQPELAARLTAAGLLRAGQHHWEHLLPRWQAQFQRVLLRPSPTFYTRLVARWLFPLHEKLKRHGTLARLAELERSQWQSPARLGAMQDSQLCQLLQHAAYHVPYYRSANYRALKLVRSTSELGRLPVLGKDMIRQQSAALISPSAKRLKAMSTGGSSGEPLRFLVGRERISHDVAARWRTLHWWGVELGDREALMWGSPIELAKQDRVRRWRDTLFRSHLLPAFDLSPATLARYVRKLQRYRPRILSGYPSALCTLATYACEQGIRLDGLGVAVIFVTAERLYEQQRALLERCFAAPVANGYGSREGGFIAHQCPAGGMHIAAEDILVEILDEHDQPVPAGQTGQIVVTHLASGDFPFIRYATGDRGSLDPAPCPCGRSLPLLRNIEGRSTDFIVACDGTVMHGLALIYIVRELDYVRQFRIIQESALCLRIQLVLALNAQPDLQRSVVAPIRERVGQAMAIELELLSELPVEACGKFRYIINRLPLMHAGAHYAG